MSVVPYQRLALAEEGRRWDRAAAERRVRRWAGAAGDDGLAARRAQGRYRKAFVWLDEAAPENLGSYKLQIGDVIGGELRAVPRAVISAAGILQGARGGVDIPEADRAKARRHLARYYRSMGRTPPWEDGGRSTTG
jgi:hypothetical protein